MEERLMHLERQKREQNDQINALMSYQMNQNRINNNYNPNGLVLSANNILPPIGYRLTNIKQQNGGLMTPIEKKYYIYPKTDKEFYKKEKKLKQYKKNINELKELLEQERMKRKMHRNLRNNVYNEKYLNIFSLVNKQIKTKFELIISYNTNDIIRKISDDMIFFAGINNLYFISIKKGIIVKHIVIPNIYRIVALGDLSDNNILCAAMVFRKHFYSFDFFQI